MSPVTPIPSLRKRIRIPTRSLVRSGPHMRKQLSEIPSYTADESENSMNLIRLFGMVQSKQRKVLVFYVYLSGCHLVRSATENFVHERQKYLTLVLVLTKANIEDVRELTLKSVRHDWFGSLNGLVALMVW